APPSMPAPPPPGMHRPPVVPRAPLPERPRLVSSAHGALGEMLLTIPRYVVESPDGAPNPLGAAVRDLVHKLPAYTRFVVLTHESARSDVHAWLERAAATQRSTVITIPEYLHFSVWAEDSYAIVQDADGQGHFVEPFEFPRYADGLIADCVS